LKTRSVVFLCSAFLLASRPAFSDSFDPLYWSFGPDAPRDPQVQVARHARGLPYSTPVYGLDFEFFAPIGTGIFDFINANDETFRTLTITITPGGPGDKGELQFTCKSTGDAPGPAAFSDCSFLEKGDYQDPTVVRFSGGPGLPPLDFFSLYLNGFAPHSDISVEATYAAIPEPATLLTCVSGLLGFALSRRKRAG